jgi:hypothetical protein
MRRQRVLEGDCAGENAAVEFGQHDVHREIGGAESAGAVPPRRASRGGAHDLQHGNARRIERRRLADVAAGSERRRGDDDRGSKQRKRAAQKFGSVAILQAGDEERSRRQAAGAQSGAQGVDRRRVGGEQHGAIEDDRHDRLARFARGDQLADIDCAFARQVAGEARHRPRPLRLERVPGVAGKGAQQGAQILAAAFAEEAEQGVQLRGWQRRGGGEAGVVTIFARQHRELDGARARQRRQPFDAVSPPIEAAEQAHDDHPGVGGDAVDPQIDRHGMAQVAQMREPHARQHGAFRFPRRGKAGEVAVGEREHDDLARRLAEIDRFDDFVEVGRSRRQQMHRPPRRLTRSARASPPRDRGP